MVYFCSELFYRMKKKMEFLWRRLWVFSHCNYSRATLNISHRRHSQIGNGQEATRKTNKTLLIAVRNNKTKMDEKPSLTSYLFGLIVFICFACNVTFGYCPMYTNANEACMNNIFTTETHICKWYISRIPHFTHMSVIWIEMSAKWKKINKNSKLFSKLQFCQRFNFF